MGWVGRGAGRSGGGGGGGGGGGDDDASVRICVFAEG